MNVAVGSTNPTKIDPVRSVFSRHFPDVQVTGVSVTSGVADQPMDEDAMYRGAVTRARAALRAVPDADYGVGIEGGLRRTGFGWYESSLVAITNRAGKIGVGSSGGLILPDAVMHLIHGGKTLEQAIDELYGTEKIGRGIGMFGVMTDGVVTRTEGVRHGVAFALARFIHEAIYDRKA